MCTINFNSIIVIIRWDWFEIRDGDNEGAPLIGSRICGSSAPNSITSSGNQLFIKFHSDSSVTKTGYRVRVDIGKKEATHE